MQMYLFQELTLAPKYEGQLWQTQNKTVSCSMKETHMKRKLSPSPNSTPRQPRVQRRGGRVFLGIRVSNTSKDCSRSAISTLIHLWEASCTIPHTPTGFLSASPHSSTPSLPRLILEFVLKRKIRD